MKVDRELISTACDRVRSDTGFEAGAEIKTTRLFEALGVPDYPAREKGEADRAYVRRCERHRMRHISLLEALRERLLEVHKVDLQATGRGSYQITPPGQQARKAEKDGLRAAKKALRGASERIKHVDVSKLTDEQKLDREASMLNTAHRLGMLSGKTPSRVLEEARAESEEKVRTQSSADMPMPRPG